MKIAHLSDLHFGTERSGIVTSLLNDLHVMQPDYIIISGDLTQRALTSQYKQARQFLDELKPFPYLCVPGNHDISLHNPFERFFYPYHKYQKYIAPNLCPAYANEHIAILGLNSVTPFKTMSGYVTEEQLKKAQDYFSVYADRKVKMIVMHHNLIRSERHKIINDADKIIAALSSCHVNLVLSGHIHAPHVEQLKHDFLRHNMYIITAGTAVSWRTTEPNSFNMLEINQEAFKLRVHEYQNATFVASDEKIYPL